MYFAASPEDFFFTLGLGTSELAAASRMTDSAGSAPNPAWPSFQSALGASAAAATLHPDEAEPLLSLAAVCDRLGEHAEARAEGKRRLWRGA